MPELPEIQAHAERLTERFRGRSLRGFRPISFTVLKTATPSPDEAVGHPLVRVGRRGKYLLVEFEPAVFAVHLMQGGRLVVDSKQTAKPRGGQARFVFDEGPALLLTEQGSERRAGVWCLPSHDVTTTLPLAGLGPEADHLAPDDLLERFRRHPNQRIHGFLRDQRLVAGLGRRLANEVCHRARLSPFAMTHRLGPDEAATVVEAIRACVAGGLEYERSQGDMGASKDRPSSVHGRTGQSCPVCGDPIGAVEYTGYTVHYCPTCQTGGKVLADNTTSRFLK